MADPVEKTATPAAPAAKASPAAPKAAAPKAGAPAAKEGKPKPKESPKDKSGKPRFEPLNINLGRTGLPQESALPIKKAAPKPAPAAAGAKPAPGAKLVPGAKPAAPPPKAHYIIIENLCVGCGLCLDKCPPKVNAIGYKFYGDVQEGGFRCYIDQDACISCSACFSTDECPSGALIEVQPDGEVLDFTYTPPDRLDFDLRFLHRFHREVR